MCSGRPLAPKPSSASCWLQCHTNPRCCPSVQPQERRELDVVPLWQHRLIHGAGGVNGPGWGTWMLWPLLLLQRGFPGFGWRYLFHPDSGCISTVLLRAQGLWGKFAAVLLTDNCKPKVNPWWIMLDICHCDSSFWAQAEKIFHLWFMWVELLLLDAFEQRGLKVCGSGTSLKAFFSPLGD